MNERLLTEKLDALAAAVRGDCDVLCTLDAFVRSVADDALVRINPVRFAKQYALPIDAVVETFLHARKVGLVTME